jgi:hypothetical protein
VLACAVEQLRSLARRAAAKVRHANLAVETGVARLVRHRARSKQGGVGGGSRKQPRPGPGAASASEPGATGSSPRKRAEEIGM